MLSHNQFTIREIEDGIASRFFKNKFRWIGLLLAVSSVFILSSANIYSMGWLVVKCGFV